MKKLGISIGVVAAATTFLVFLLHEPREASAGLPVCDAFCVDEIRDCKAEESGCEQECFNNWLGCRNRADVKRDRCLQAATEPHLEAQCEAEYDAEVEDCDVEDTVCRNRCSDRCERCASPFCQFACGLTCN